MVNLTHVYFSTYKHNKPTFPSHDRLLFQNLRMLVEFLVQNSPFVPPLIARLSPSVYFAAVDLMNLRRNAILLRDWGGFEASKQENKVSTSHSNFLSSRKSLQSSPKVDYWFPHKSLRLESNPIVPQMSPCKEWRVLQSTPHPSWITQLKEKPR